MADLSGVKFFTHKSWDAERRVLRLTLCYESGEPVCAVEASPLTRTVSVCPRAADGTFLPAEEFKAGERGPEVIIPLTPEQVRAFYEDIEGHSKRRACPHCGNAEGNADRLRCFICNREI